MSENNDGIPVVLPQFPRVFAQFPRDTGRKTWPTLDRIVGELEQTSKGVIFVDRPTMHDLEADLNSWGWANQKKLIGLIDDGRLGWCVRGVMVFCHE